jgi:hypothetical protein
MIKSFLHEAVWLIAPVAVILFLLDLGIVFVERNSDLLKAEVDIQTPATLFEKLRYLHGLEERHVVFLGDSVVYGRRMEEAGDRNWRAHTIAAHTERLLRASTPDRRVRALDLGMNGALPTDLEQMTRLVLVARPDCIVYDVNLRSFSADFVAEKDRASRPWIAGMTIDAGFDIVTSREGLPLTAQFETAMRDLAISHWRLYGLRDFLQWLIFDGEPESATRRLRTWLDGMLRTAPGEAADPTLDDVVLMLKAKARYGSVFLDPNHPQVQALKRTLDLLASRKQCAVFFYATEDKARLAELIAPERYRVLLDQLGLIFAPYASQGIVYIPPLDGLESELYIDYGHLKDPGNAFVAHAIVERGLETSLAAEEKMGMSE